MRELEKIKRERQEQKEKEVGHNHQSLCMVFSDNSWVQEREREAKEQEQREYDIARGNPLLNPQDFNIKRRWDDDVVFKNQARGSEVKKGPEFVNVSTSTSWRGMPSYSYTLGSLALRLS